MAGGKDTGAGGRVVHVDPAAWHLETSIQGVPLRRATSTGNVAPKCRKTRLHAMDIPTCDPSRIASRLPTLSSPSMSFQSLSFADRVAFLVELAERLHLY